MDIAERDRRGAQPVPTDIRDKLLEPFIAATCAALGEMANVDVACRAAYQNTLDHALGDISVMLDLDSATRGCMVLSFPQQTAEALAGRVLAGVTQELDEGMIRDCLGEIANVIAGQAKALLAGTPYRFEISIPEVVARGSSEPRSGQGRDCLIVAFRCDLGEFTLQLILKT